MFNFQNIETPKTVDFLTVLTPGKKLCKTPPSWKCDVFVTLAASEEKNSMPVCLFPIIRKVLLTREKNFTKNNKFDLHEKTIPKKGKKRSCWQNFAFETVSSASQGFCTTLHALEFCNEFQNRNKRSSGTAIFSVEGEQSLITEITPSKLQKNFFLWRKKPSDGGLVGTNWAGVSEQFESENRQNKHNGWFFCLFGQPRFQSEWQS